MALTLERTSVDYDLRKNSTGMIRFKSIFDISSSTASAMSTTLALPSFMYHIMTSPIVVCPPEGPHGNVDISKQQNRTRRFFSLLKLMPDARHDGVLPWGQTVGEFSMWYVCHTHKQRLKKPGRSAKRKRQPTVPSGQSKYKRRKR